MAKSDRQSDKSEIRFYVKIKWDLYFADEAGTISVKRLFGKWAQMKFLCEIEKDFEANEYVASCDELRAVASGATEEEAVNNLVVAIKQRLAEYGGEISLSNRKRVVVEVM